MLINASQDSIINTAKSVGLDPNAVAVNTAIADQAFFASMQTQGRLAQNYLPLAKAYLTAIIIGLSWLIAIIAIIFGNYAHLKMFFTLCLWIFLWTPIFCLINFLNDLNLIKTAEIILDKKEALTISSNMLIFKKIAANSNFINYLIMAVPILAFAIAKGTEHGLVSFASSLSQAVSGAARSASSFTTQQALSTSTAIAAPRADELIATSGGITTHTSGISAGSGRFSINTISDGGTTITDTNTNSKVSYDNSGITSASISGLNANDIKSKQISLTSEVSKTIGDTLKTGTTSQDIANMAFDKSSSHGINAQAQEIFKASAIKAFDKMAQAGDTKASEIAGALKGGAVLLNNGGSISITEKDGTSRTYNFTEKEMEQWNKEFANNVASTYTNDSSARSSLNNTFSTFTGKEFSQVHSAIDKYNSVESLSQSVNVNSIPQALNSYIQSGDNPTITNAWNNGNKEFAVSTATNDFQNWATNNPQQLSKYFGAGGFNSPSNTIGTPDMKNYHSPNLAKEINNGNVNKVDNSAVNFADQYENNSKTLQDGHLAQAGQNTSWKNSSGKIKNEVENNVKNVEQEFKNGAIKRTGQNVVDGSQPISEQFGQFTKNPVKYVEGLFGDDNDNKGNNYTPKVPPNPLTGK